ncbi:hypothetical protein JX266_004825 [Neoarthrinium moseri]|nr:hypothetical protein JX266_004825 [Neoarthrinium moseri]
MSDEEMGKKDDDHVPSAVNVGLRKPNWHPARAPQRRGVKRIALALLALGLVYLFIHNIPTDLGPRNAGRPMYTDRRPHSATTKGGAQSGIYGDDASAVAHTYTGPPRFLELAASLHAISTTRGGMLLNKNILFATSSLKSAAALLPVACQMGRESRNYVHFALMSRSQISIEELKSINGMDESCQIIFHDARTDKAAIMTDERMEYSTFRALHHVHMYMHPQAIIVDGSGSENWFFTKGAAAHVKATGNTLIELPHSAQKLLWITKLDSRSLRAWNDNHVDILIQATPGASGSLIRLLRSLSSADFSSCSIPHLTIELPHDIDPPTKQYLETFQWPPAHIPNPTSAKYVTLRHRIPRRGLTEEESSVEVAPNFFHYIKYTLLEYRYSEASHIQHWDARLFGISLEQPLQHLSGKARFSPPLSLHEATETEVASSFLWQAPTSNAMLFMGEKWAEMHDLVSRSFEIQQGSSDVPALLAKKEISREHPSWLEHALRLSRLRGYWTLYPGEDTAKSLATVHTDLRHSPEEYSKSADEVTLTDESSDKDFEDALKRLKAGPESNLELHSSLQSLVEAGSLRPFGNLPLLTWDGRKTDLERLDSLAADYAIEFITQVGKCEDETRSKRIELSVQDLFCTTSV